MSIPQFRAHLAYHSASIIKRAEDAAKEEARLEVQKNQEAEENLTAYQVLLLKNNISNTDALPMMVIPSCSLSLSALPAERTKKFAETLHKLAFQALSADFQPSEEDNTNQQKCAANNQLIEQSKSLSEINCQVCTLCKGGCCTQGADHAYLTAATLQRFIQSDSEFKLKHELQATEVVQRYVERIPQRSLENSCLFQTDTGCSLTREMRSDTCNGYLCDELKAYNLRFTNQAHTPAPLEGAVVISRALDNWQKRNHSGNNPIIQSVIIKAD